MATLKDLEKRVSELERNVKKFIDKLEGKQEDDKPISNKKSKKKEGSSCEKKSKKKKKPNKFLIAMNEARKKRQDKFEYNGAVYIGSPHDKLGMIYRKEK